jgi:hypothetical protein
MSTLFARGQFNGAVLVAEHGHILYRQGFGEANFQTGEKFTPQTPSNVGSVTKQFTAMAVMILAQRNKLNYDDLAAKYIPEFSRSSHVSKITLRHLLTHTSGIPDYGDLGISDAGLTPKGLITAILEKEALLAKTGQKYRYSNPDIRYWRLSRVSENICRYSGNGTAGWHSSTFVYGSRENEPVPRPSATINSNKSMIAALPRFPAMVGFFHGGRPL